MTRLFGIRDTVLGAGALVSLNREQPEVDWVRMGAVADTADAAIAVVCREELGTKGMAGTLGVAVPAAALGWKASFGIARDR
ncbi:MAG: hypothetical protein R2698_08415 [Microthrixaceae bacterium]